jgi:methionyl aminopeptidase
MIGVLVTEAASGDGGRLLSMFPMCTYMVTDRTLEEEKKRKKRRRPKKKNEATPGVLSPPRVPVSNLFPSGVYPTGETMDYRDEKLARTTGEEIRYKARFDDEFLSDYRQAAEVHRQVRQWTQQNVKPGQTLTEIAEGIEDGVRALLGNQGLELGDGLRSGMGFPTGLCLNNCAAHFTPNRGAKEIILQKEDIMSIDFGVHVNGRIVDSAFTLAFDPLYDNLLAAVKDATNTGIEVSQLFKLYEIRFILTLKRPLASMSE